MNTRILPGCLVISQFIAGRMWHLFNPTRQQASDHEAEHGKQVA
jgi:hypothetical protein